jgi:heme A synthase
MLQTQDLFAALDRSFAWSLYLGAAVLMLAIMFWFTRRWQRNLRWLLLGALAVLVLMPAPVANHPALAPAFVVAAFGLLTHNADAMAPVLVRFALAGVVLLVLVIVEGVWWHRRHRGGAAARRGQGAGKKRSAP